MDSKECSRCKDVLSISSFNKNKKMKDGRSKVCKRCTRSAISLNKMKKRGAFGDDSVLRSLEKSAIKKSADDLKSLRKSVKNEVKMIEEYLGFLKTISVELESKRTSIYNKSYYLDNISTFREKSYKRMLKEKSAIPKWLSKDHKKEIKLLYDKSWEMTHSIDDGEVYQVDHIIPLQGKEVCGLHVPWNLRIITREENIKKRNSLISDLL